MLHQLSIVHKLPLDGPLAAVAQEAIQVWLKQHVPGKPHPSGSPSAAVAKEVLPFLIDSKKPEPITEKAWKDFLTALRTIVQADGFQAVVSQELALFSARANAKKTHLILELRMKMHSFLVPHSSTYIKLIEDFEGETLGKRPMGALARKARGLSIVANQSQYRLRPSPLFCLGQRPRCIQASPAIRCQEGAGQCPCRC